MRRQDGSERTRRVGQRVKITLYDMLKELIKNDYTKSDPLSIQIKLNHVF